MPPRTLNFTLDPASTEPIYRQIARAISDEIRRGRFRPGDALPGYRTLAEELGVSRNTAMAAYRELQTQGLIDGAAGSGTRVAAELPPASASMAIALPSLGFDLHRGAGPSEAAWDRNLLQVASGNPDPRLLPGDALAQAYRRALTVNVKSTLTADDPGGNPRLRAAIAALLSSAHGVPSTPEQVLVTRGTQLPLSLVAQVLLAPGDAVAVEALGARSAWEAFARAGARCVPVPVDAEGLDVETLDRLAATEGLRAVLVTPRRQYPTLAPLSPTRRARLLALAAERRLAVLESDLDGEFQFDGPALPPLAAEDRGGVVIYLSALSKVFSPGLRLGFVHGPAPFLAALRAARIAHDRHGDPVLERAMAELVEDGELQRHLNKMHQAYRHRRDLLCGALRRELGEAVEAVPPPGGLALWVKVRDGVDVDAWSRRALEHGVAFQAGRQFAFDGEPVQGLRMGFSGADDGELIEAARRMRAALGAG